MERKIFKITRESGIPLIGHIAFGIVDRGTNVLQVRCTSVCNINCVFCSTDGGPSSISHFVNYVVEPGYLLQYVKEIVEFKGDVEILLDSVGDPTTYPFLVELIRDISKINGVKKITFETNGLLLNKKKIKDFEKAGLNQINLSIHSLGKNLSKELSGVDFYDINKILDIAREIAKSKIKLLITPVWIPGVNDQGMVELIKFSKEIKSGIGIQKYEIHKYGRKIKKVDRLNWYTFYKQLKEWEKEYSIKLIMSARGLGIEKRESLPIIFRKNEKIDIKIKAHGWRKDQMIGVAKNRAISIVNCNSGIDKIIKVKILENKNNIYIAKPI